MALLSRTAAGAAPDGIFNGADGEDEFQQGFSRHLAAYCFLLFVPLPPHFPPSPWARGYHPHARLFSSSVCRDADNYCVSFYYHLSMIALRGGGSIDTRKCCDMFTWRYRVNLKRPRTDI